MTPISINLPERLSTFVENQISGGGFANTDDYFQWLIAKAIVEQKKKDLEVLLLERLDAMDNGDEIRVTPELMTKMKEEFLQRHRQVQEQ
ncbi:MAG: hypothetical protein L0Y72_26470 [Gemmataceae bacterium]|nr:hypothetical protein [Gemmataceae bacterium]MCI0742593.1 hypothetical protein [Gemmataceae bacterium]